ncbi:MAG: phosphate ABC transporter permease subunit PstC [Planctomycetes bacterium]|nr:phosphate ABC transporter permease subunit PstC [Planctomycetota bacterium]MCB9869196.1 phosphate ABC transporter permease subunit PstC [Planctomycetota bacterium]
MSSSDLPRPPITTQRSRFGERLILKGLLLCALLSIASTTAIVMVLGKESALFFQHVPLSDFLFGTEWHPVLNPPRFGVLPLVCGTFLIVAGAGLVALPIGLGTAIYLGEYASQRTRDIIKPVLEVLAGIPTVVYGYLALTLITPMIRAVFQNTGVFNAASAAIVVGIMILPMVASLCDDAIRAVPDGLRQGAHALGTTNFEVSTRVVVPAALSGIIASFVLAISRAIGETMAVTLAAGATPKLTLNPLESIQTMTAFIVQLSLGDTPNGTIEYQTIFAVGALLFVITLVMNVIAGRVLRRFREVYE